jgi:chemotaxis protein CheY-P-specific phosphatase CheC
MNTILKDAIKNYIESIEANISECKSNPKKGYVAKISINGDENMDISVVVPEKKLDYIAELWFGDKEDYDKEDLTKEIANQIVGNAKIIASKKGINFDISTPEYLGEYKNIKYDNILKYKFKNRCFYILMKDK